MKSPPKQYRVSDPGRDWKAGIRLWNHFRWVGLANGRRQIESRYPTQAKVRLEWGTQHLLPMWQEL